MDKADRRAVLAARIDDAIARKEWGQADLARALGVTRQQVHKMLTEERDPPWSVVCEIADALGVSLDWLGGRKESSAVRLTRGKR